MVFFGLINGLVVYWHSMVYKQDIRQTECRGNGAMLYRHGSDTEDRLEVFLNADSMPIWVLANGKSYKVRRHPSIKQRLRLTWLAVSRQ